MEQDAAGEEPVLPSGWSYNGIAYLARIDSEVTVTITPDWVKMVHDHVTHIDRQRLQDKREKEVEVTDAMVDAAMNVPLRSDDTCADVIRRRLEDALNCRDEADEQ